MNAMNAATVAAILAAGWLPVHHAHRDDTGCTTTTYVQLAPDGTITGVSPGEKQCPPITNAKRRGLSR